MTLSAHVKDSQALSSQIDNLLNTLGWDRDHLIQWYKANSAVNISREEESHIVPGQSNVKHSRKTRRTFHQEKTPKSSLPFYTQSRHVVSFVSDPAQCSANHNPVQPLPLEATPGQLVDISRAVKQEGHSGTLAVPDLVQRAKEEREQMSYGHKTREQILAEERDYKRRRKTYRTKNGRKKPIEIQRDLVEGYMNDLSILYQ